MRMGVIFLFFTISMQYILMVLAISMCKDLKERGFSHKT